MAPSRFDPLARGNAASPYGSYAALRRDTPVYRVPGAGYFVVSRIEDVRAVVGNPELFSSQIAPALGADRTVPAGNADTRPLPAATGVLQRLVRDVSTRGAERPAVLATADPPTHTRQRQVTRHALGPCHGPELEHRLRSMADELLEDLAGDRPVEWMSRFALQLPLRVTAEVLGLPRDDLPKLKRWTSHAVASVSGSSTPASILAHAQAWAELERYVAARLEAEAAGPTDGALGRLARAIVDGPDGVTPVEAVSIVIQLLVGGNESTSSLLGSAVLMLASHPVLQEQLRAHPALIPLFVEEALRLESPFQGHFRVATADTEIRGVRIPAGARVLLLWGAANRDEHAFARPDEIDLERANPRDHVAFGESIHYCVGARLARLETRVALEALLARFSHLRLAPGHRPAYLPSLFVRRPAQLELEIAP